MFLKHYGQCGGSCCGVLCCQVRPWGCHWVANAPALLWSSLHSSEALGCDCTVHVVALLWCSLRPSETMGLPLGGPCRCPVGQFSTSHQRHNRTRFPWSSAIELGSTPTPGSPTVRRTIIPASSDQSTETISYHRTLSILGSNFKYLPLHYLP